MEGFGKCFYTDGSLYIGAWLNNLRHGNGTHRFANNDVYKGQFRLGKIQGKGNFTTNNGATYIGEFHNSAKNGEGKTC